MPIGELAMHYVLKKTHFAVTVQLDNIKAKKKKKKKSSKKIKV